MTHGFQADATRFGTNPDAASIPVPGSRCEASAVDARGRGGPVGHATDRAAAARAGETGLLDGGEGPAFNTFDLPPSLLSGLARAGFCRATPIQALSLPLALAGRDVAAQAQTGTGKTAAYLLAVMAELLRESKPPSAGRPPRALIVAPTRELAIQIHKDAERLGADTQLVAALAYGGAAFDAQAERLAEGVDLVIGTPGRLIDFHKRRLLDLRAVRVAVIDEADRMFDLGFIRDVRYLLRRCPPPGRRRTHLFSATLSWRVMELAHEHMVRPETVIVEAKQRTADGAEQRLYAPANADKLPLLVHLLREAGLPRSIVFVNTKRAAHEVQAALRANGVEARALSGDVAQDKRQRLLERFAEGDLPVLVATDVAARGLHIPDVSLVVNFDLPQSGEDYVHRVGRTARAGATGRAVSFCCEDTAFHLPDIESYLGTRIPTVPMPARLPELLPASRALVAEDRDGPAAVRGGSSPGGGRRARRRSADARRRGRAPSSS